MAEIESTVGNGEIERNDLAVLAAGQIERLSNALIAQSRPDPVYGSDPRPIPPTMMVEIALCVRELSRTVMSAIDDHLVPIEVLRTEVFRGRDHE